MFIFVFEANLTFACVFVGKLLHIHVMIVPIIIILVINAVRYLKSFFSVFVICYLMHFALGFVVCL